MASQYKLTYFEARYLAEPIRLIFALKGINFEDIRMKREEWPKIKTKSEYLLGTLPILHDGQIAVSQSGTIQRYLGKKLNLIGNNDLENAKCDELIEIMTDLRTAFAKAFFEDEYQKDELVIILANETFPKYLRMFDGLLAENNGWFVGKNITIADLNIASFLQIFSEPNWLPGVLDSYKNVKLHQEKVFNTEGIKEWIALRPKTVL